MGCPYHCRVAALNERARRARSTFRPLEEPPARDRAMEYLRDGVATAVGLYREAPTAGERDPPAPGLWSELDNAFRAWLELYAACYGVFVEVEVSVVRAAALRERGLSLREMATRVTGVPPEDIHHGGRDRLSLPNQTISYGRD